MRLKNVIFLNNLGRNLSPNFFFGFLKCACVCARTRVSVVPSHCSRALCLIGSRSALLAGRCSRLTTTIWRPLFLHTDRDTHCWLWTAHFNPFNTPGQRTRTPVYAAWNLTSSLCPSESRKRQKCALTPLVQRPFYPSNTDPFNLHLRVGLKHVLLEWLI